MCEEHTGVFPSTPLRVLFLCTENNARSQMAEALLRHRSGGCVEAYSAGVAPTHLHPYAVRVMERIGIDISRQRPKHISEVLDLPFTYVVTVCDRVYPLCPDFPGRPCRLHWGLPNPEACAASEVVKFRVFLQTRAHLERLMCVLLSLIDIQYRWIDTTGA